MTHPGGNITDLGNGSDRWLNLAHWLVDCGERRLWEKNPQIPTDLLPSEALSGWQFHLGWLFYWGEPKDVYDNCDNPALSHE